MKDINNWNVTGRVKSFELKQLATGTSVINLFLEWYTSHRVDGFWKEKLNSMECNIWGPFAETIYPFLKDGIGCTVFAELEEHKWNDVAGNMFTKIKAKVRTIKIHGGREWEVEKENQQMNTVSDVEAPYSQTENTYGVPTQDKPIQRVEY